MATFPQALIPNFNKTFYRVGLCGVIVMLLVQPPTINNELALRTAPSVPIQPTHDIKKIFSYYEHMIDPT